MRLPATSIGRVTSVGRYEILRELGRGGMATVYLAHQSDLDRDVALKELRLTEGPEREVARRFLREARLAGSFSHPNIVTVHDYFEQGGTPYIAMEYLPRGPLRPYVGQLSLAQVGGVLEGVLAGLAHAEERKVVHRDLKPENLMVTSQGGVKIADFGIAKATSEAQATASLTTAGTTLGTPRYMAPERALGQELGPWSDLYSVGVIAFELLVGRTPFHDTVEPMAVLLRQINDPIPPVNSLVPDVDQELSDWIERLLVKDPEQRTQAASQAWDTLEEILIDRLGPRWQRGSALPARPGDPGAVVPVSAPASMSSRARFSAAVTPVLAAVAGAESATAATIAPPTAGRRAAPRRRTPLAAGRLVLVALAAGDRRARRQPGAQRPDPVFVSGRRRAVGQRRAHRPDVRQVVLGTSRRRDQARRVLRELCPRPPRRGRRRRAARRGRDHRPGLPAGGERREAKRRQRLRRRRRRRPRRRTRDQTRPARSRRLPIRRPQRRRGRRRRALSGGCVGNVN